MKIRFFNNWHIWIMFIFNLNVVFTFNFIKMALNHVHFSPGFTPLTGFPVEEFAPVCFLNYGGAPLRSPSSAEAAPAEFGVRRGMLRRSSRTTHKQFAPQKPVFPHVVSYDEIAPQKILIVEEILG
jgi:hypothetical protein